MLVGFVVLGWKIIYLEVNRLIFGNFNFIYVDIRIFKCISNYIYGKFNYL